MSPRTKKQNDAIREQRKEEILNAAVHVYAAKGYSAAAISDVADRAGLAHGLVFYYFKNKKKLFRELYESMMDQSLRYTTMHFEQDGPVIEQFRQYVALICERLVKEPHTQQFYMRISLDLHHLYESGEISPFEWMKNFIEPMAHAIERGIKQDAIRQGDAYLMAMQFWGAVSQGMSYLDQYLQQLQVKSMSAVDCDIEIQAKIRQITESSLLFLRE